MLQSKRSPSKWSRGRDIRSTTPVEAKSKNFKETYFTKAFTKKHSADKTYSNFMAKTHNFFRLRNSYEEEEIHNKSVDLGKKNF
mmetsp:Transcript_7102/g.6301  ORF Transcript_7102/g.6301 Transcript_7102/m.6301 type:complete len:84 (+) Transcript_7102:340-591(+)